MGLGLGLSEIVLDSFGLCGTVLDCVGLCENVLDCVGLCGIGEVGGMAWGSTACLSQHGLLMSVGGKYSRMIMFFPLFFGGVYVMRKI